MQRKNTIGCGTKAEGNNPDLLSRKGDIIIIQDHSHGHEQGGQGAHFNVRPEGEKRNGHIGNTKDHYLIHKLDEEKNPAKHYVLGNEYIGLDHNYYLTDEQESVLCLIG